MFFIICLHENEKMPDEQLLKICIVGSSDLKTEWIRRYAEGKFTADYLLTHGMDITTKQIQVDGNNIKLILVDIASQEYFGKLGPSYYRGSAAAVITFDKSNRDSFNAVKDWYKEIKSIHLSIPIALVGFIRKIEPKDDEPKVDLSTFLKIQKRLKKSDWIDWANRIDWGNNEEITNDENMTNNEEKYVEVTTDEGQSLAEEMGFSYYETRPNDKKTTGQIFHDLTLKILGRDASSSKC